MGHRNGSPKNRRGKQWDPPEIQKLKKLARRNTPTPLIADVMGRTEASIYSKASKRSVSLKPTNKSPYNRQKKK